MTAKDVPARAHRGGRPRNPDTDLAIRRAARALIVERGIEGFTYGAIAARTGLARTTVARRYPDRFALVSRVVDEVVMLHPDIDTGDFATELLAALWGAATVARHPVVAPLLGIGSGQVGASAQVATVARTAVIEDRIRSVERAYTRAIARGDLPLDAPVRACALRVLAPVLLHAALTGARLTTTDVADIVRFEQRALRIPTRRKPIRVSIVPRTARSA